MQKKKTKLIKINHLKSRDFNHSSINFLLQVLRSLAIHGTSNRHTRTNNLINSTRKFLRHRPRTHNPGDVNDILKGYVSIVVDMLGLLAVTFGLFQRLDDKCRCRRNHLNCRLTILHDELGCHLYTLPVFGSHLSNVFSYLFWGETEWTDFGSKWTRRTHLAAGDSDLHLGYLWWIKLWRHGGLVV